MVKTIENNNDHFELKPSLAHSKWSIAKFHPGLNSKSCDAKV